MEATLHVWKEGGIMQWESTQPSIEITCFAPTILTPMTGRIRVNDGKKTLQLESMRMMFLRPGDSVTLVRDGAELPAVCRICFESYRLAQHDDDTIMYRNDRSGLPASGWITNKLPYRATVLVNELVRLQANPSGHTAKAERHHHLFKELMQLVLHYETTPELDWEPSIHRAITYIDENYRSPITRSELARLAGFHTSYFSTMFAKKLGWGYSEYLNRVRIDRAKEHLLASTMTINEIALEVGYSNGEYLSRKFKQLTGMSPGEFRSRPAPKKIAAFQFAGALLALGVTPVATDAELVRGSLLLQEELRDVPIIKGAYDDEQLGKLKPDLILAPTYFYHTPGRMKQLEKIAPVLTLEWAKLDPLAEMQLIGKLIGRESEAQRWLTKYQAQVDEARQSLRALIDRGETAAVYEWRSDGIFIWDKTARGAFNLYEALGIRPPETVRRDVLVRGKHLWITEDRLPDYMADHMFVIDARDDQSDEGEHVLASMHGKGRVYRLSLNEFWSSGGLALERQLRIQTNCLIAGETE
ncbi:helix-turn-helix domain-containing protein [Brevibacillus parabrevis]|uniref:helix-turn-helix domain-containing protein n=1 Tax=Brevibacillus parabrevis TaxID=54914 RepID=UPI001F60FA61|nr:AraC family transcriptional regulator [Brevibacillus parabrevis]